jgi:hypothetical protein
MYIKMYIMKCCLGRTWYVGYYRCQDVSEGSWSLTNGLLLPSIYNHPVFRFSKNKTYTYCTRARISVIIPIGANVPYSVLMFSKHCGFDSPYSELTASYAPRISYAMTSIGTSPYAGSDKSRHMRYITRLNSPCKRPHHNA